MYFWNTKKLSEELANNEVTETEKFKYFLGTNILYTFFVYYALFSISQVNTFFILEFFVVLLIVIYGSLRVYRNNGGSKGVILLERVVCLGFPLTIKITVLVWGVSFIYQWLGLDFYNTFNIEDTEKVHYMIFFILAVLAQYLFFWRMWVHIGNVAILSNASKNVYRDRGLVNNTVRRLKILRQELIYETKIP